MLISTEVLLSVANLSTFADAEAPPAVGTMLAYVATIKANGLVDPFFSEERTITDLDSAAWEKSNLMWNDFLDSLATNPDVGYWAEEKHKFFFFRASQWGKEHGYKVVVADNLS